MLSLTAVGALRAQINPDWTEPFPPFRIAGNLYYVGGKDLASYLITTSEGHILINSNLEANVPQIEASVKELGFRFEDVKILLISHAHFDHCAGSAAVKRRTGARYMVMAADVPVVESGGASDFRYGSEKGAQYPPAKVDSVLHDGDTVRLGDAALVAHHTPGHTKGCTAWTFRVQEGGRARDVVIVGSSGVNPGYNLIDDPQYPTMAADYEQAFRTLKRLRCDYFLGAHGLFFDLLAKQRKMKRGRVSPFIDPKGFRQYVQANEQNFREKLAAQQAERR